MKSAMLSISMMRGRGLQPSSCDGGWSISLTSWLCVFCKANGTSSERARQQRPPPVVPMLSMHMCSMGNQTQRKGREGGRTLTPATGSSASLYFLYLMVAGAGRTVTLFRLVFCGQEHHVMFRPVNASPLPRLLLSADHRPARFHPPPGTFGLSNSPAASRHSQPRDELKPCAALSLWNNLCFCPVSPIFVPLPHWSLSSPATETSKPGNLSINSLPHRQLRAPIPWGLKMPLGAVHPTPTPTSPPKPPTTSAATRRIPLHGEHAAASVESPHPPVPAIGPRYDPRATQVLSSPSES